MNYLFNPGTSKGNHRGAKANDVELQGCSMLPGTRGAQCASAPAGDRVFLLSLHHGICPHMLVSCRHNWFIPTCLSKNYIEGKCKFTKCPAGSDAHDCGFSLQAFGSHIFGFMVWNEEGEMKNCDWQVCKQGHGKVLQWRTENEIFTEMHLCSYCFSAIFGLIADWGHILMTFSIIARSIKTCVRSF